MELLRQIVRSLVEKLVNDPNCTKLCASLKRFFTVIATVEVHLFQTGRKGLLLKGLFGVLTIVGTSSAEYF